MKKEMRKQGAFRSDAEFEDAYERFLANLPQAGDTIMGSHARMESSFRDYLDAFEKWVFRHAYESGYAAAAATYSGGPDARGGQQVGT